MSRARAVERHIANSSDLAGLIALGEGFTTESKQSGISNLGREICAFANATGGVILVGVPDGGGITGVPDHNALKSRVESIARSADPAIAVEMASVDNVLCVTVPDQHGKPYSFGGRFFLRVGATCQQMSRDEIREFFFREGLIRFDEAPCRKFSLKADLSHETWKQFSKRSRIPEGMNAIKALENLHLLSERQMTNAGAWLLADDIQRFSLQAGVTCAVFRGTTKTHILDRKEYTRDLVSNFEDSMEYLQAKLNTALIPTAVGRVERLELPEDALREALVNAIAHRDYRSTANVQIYVFRDRLEIVSPGGLPAGMREEDLGARSVPRNPLLFSLLFRMGLVEQIGSGIRRIRQLCRDHGVRDPIIEVSANWFLTTFVRLVDDASGGSRGPSTSGGVAPQVLPRASPQIKTLVRVLKGERTRSEILANLNLKDRAHLALHYLKPALTEGFVEMACPDSPRSRKQKYRLTEKGRELFEDLSLPPGTTDKDLVHAAQQIPGADPSCAHHVSRDYRASRGFGSGARRRANEIGNPADLGASQPHPSRYELLGTGNCRWLGRDDDPWQAPQ